MSLETLFPRLRETGYEITSPATIEYNCVAWAAHEDERWWWPDPLGSAYWPPEVPREETVDAFIRAFSILSYEPSVSSNFEAEFEKIAIFVDRSGSPTHVARQLSNGRWTSKLGRLEDIEHTIEGLSNSAYGSVIQVLKRRIAKQLSHSLTSCIALRRESTTSLRRRTLDQIAQPHEAVEKGNSGTRMVS